MFLLACGGDSPSGVTPTTGTPPATSQRVDLSVTSQDAPVITDDAVNGGSTIACTVNFAAVTNGPGAATWLGGTLRFYSGSDRTTPVQTLSISQDTARMGWANVVLPAGQTQRATWIFTNGVPFSAEIEFTFKPDGVNTIQTSSKAAFDCMLPAPANAVPPTVTPLKLSPAGTVVIAGLPLTVDFSAVAAASLFETYVRVTGPCTVYRAFADKLVSSTAHSIDITLEHPCRLNTPMTVTVGAVDGRGLITSRDFTVPLTLVDTIRPFVFPRFNTSTSSNSAVPSGDYFGPDTLAFTLFASDNYRLAAVVWEVLPYAVKDSAVATNAKQLGTLVKVPIKAGWDGPIQLRIEARDEAGLYSPAVVTPKDSIRVHATAAGTSRSASVPGSIVALAYDARRSVVYVAQRNERRISIVSTSSMSVVGTIPTPTGAQDIDITAGGDSLLVAMYGSKLGIIDLRSTPILTTIQVADVDSASGQFLQYVTALANGHALVSTDGPRPETKALYDVNLATGAARRRTEVEVRGSAGQVPMGRSQDYRVVVLNQWPDEMAPPPGSLCLRRYTVSNDSFTPCAPSPRTGIPTLNTDGSRISIYRHLHDASLTHLAGPPEPDFNGGLYSVLSPDGSSLYETNGLLGLVRLNALTLQTIDRIPTETYSTVTPVISPNGRTVVFARESSDAPGSKVIVVSIP